MSQPAEARARAADALYHLARQHKRWEAEHRAAARAAMDARAGLLEELGITTEFRARRAENDGNHSRAGTASAR